MEKAFDRVDRRLLRYKLLSLGFGGKFDDIIKNIYNENRSTVNVNGHMV